MDLQTNNEGRFNIAISLRPFLKATWLHDSRSFLPPNNKSVKSWKYYIFYIKRYNQYISFIFVLTCQYKRYMDRQYKERERQEPIKLKHTGRIYSSFTCVHKRLLKVGENTYLEDNIWLIQQFLLIVPF